MGSSIASASDAGARAAFAAAVLAALIPFASARAADSPAAAGPGAAIPAGDARAQADPAPAAAIPGQDDAVSTAETAPSSAAAARDLSALLAGMRSATGVVAEFRETKQLALLSAPLEATGTIYFVPPDRLVRVVTSPGRSRLVIDGDRVRFEDETGGKALDLASSPVARQMIDSFVVLFNGDERRLKEIYETRFSAGGDSWTLHLVPRSSPLDRMIASFDLTGTGAHIDRMEAVEPDGDRTVTIFGKTDASHRFDDRELAGLFGTP